jgi:hypothetical protein
MFLHDDVVAYGQPDRQTQSCALSDGFVVKKGNSVKKKEASPIAGE